MSSEESTVQFNAQQWKTTRDLKAWHQTFNATTTTDFKQPAIKLEVPATSILQGSNTSSKKTEASEKKSVRFDDTVYFDDKTSSKLKDTIQLEAEKITEISPALSADISQHELKPEQPQQNIELEEKIEKKQLEPVMVQSPVLDIPGPIDIAQQERKALKVINLSKSVYLSESLISYFLPENIGNSSTLKNEFSDNSAANEKFSDKTDLCIVFYRNDFPLPNYFPEEYALLRKIRSEQKSKVIQIEVTRGVEFAGYVKATIAAIQKAYSQVGENAGIKKLKEQFAARAEQILSSSQATLDQKQQAFDGLIKAYVAIVAYQKTDEKFKIKRQSFSGNSFLSFSIESCVEEEEKLKIVRGEEKKKQLEVLSEIIKKYYPDDYSQFLEVFILSPNRNVTESSVEEKTKTTLAMNSVGQVADRNDKTKKQLSVSIADADIEQRLKRMEKHTFFYSESEADENKKKDVPKKIDSIPSVLFQPAQVENENVKKEVEKMMEKVKPVSFPG